MARSEGGNRPDPITGPTTPPKRVLMVAAIVAGLALWFLLRTYTSAGTHECRELYAAARTAADTARIDTLVTEGSRALNEPRTCGFMRHSAWWQ